MRGVQQRWWTDKLPIYHLNIPQVSLGKRTNLAIGYADEPLVHQFVCFRVSGLPLHDVTLSCFISQGDGRDLGDKMQH